MIDKIIYVIFASFVLVTITRAQNSTICDEEEENAFIPNVRDCNGWFICTPNGPEPGNCPPEFNFNPLTRGCDWPENVQCFRCPSNQTITTHNVERSCRSFVRCINGIPSQVMCERGLQFNNATGQCDLESVVRCSLGFRCPDELPINGSLIAIRDPFNCSVFHVCVGNPEPLRQECNSELHFDPVSGQCTFPNLTDCSTSPELPPDVPEDPVFTCPNDGLHPHPSSCTIYFICANGTAHEFSCGAGLHFNASTGMCDFPDLANCDRERPRRNKGQSINSFTKKWLKDRGPLSGKTAQKSDIIDGMSDIIDG